MELVLQRAQPEMRLTAEAATISITVDHRHANARRCGRLAHATSVCRVQASADAATATSSAISSLMR